MPHHPAFFTRPNIPNPARVPFQSFLSLVPHPSQPDLGPLARGFVGPSLDRRHCETRETMSAHNSPEDNHDNGTFFLTTWLDDPTDSWKFKSAGSNSQRNLCRRKIRGYEPQEVMVLAHLLHRPRTSDHFPSRSVPTRGLRDGNACPGTPACIRDDVRPRRRVEGNRCEGCLRLVGSVMGIRGPDERGDRRVAKGIRRASGRESDELRVEAAA